jgi:hypothetical protein
MHFTTCGLACGEKYWNHLIRNITHYEKTFYWFIDIIMTFQKYHKCANFIGSLVKLIPQFLPQELNVLFIQFILLVQLV